jgi:predicted metal-dependent HD superfamily phosphohydrolase
MSTPEAALRSAWHQLAGPTHEALLDDLLARHREPHRRYHTATHVMWVLRHIDHIVGAGDERWMSPHVDRDAVRLAALYHDVVYDVHRSDNEVVSADLAARVANELGWQDDRCAAVHRLVLATAGHAPAADDEAVLVDADLAVLGGEPKDYAAYVGGVRAEYAHVPADQWRAGRAEVLRRFLDMPRLFTTDVMHGEREARAKANLTAELASLR